MRILLALFFLSLSAHAEFVVPPLTGPVVDQPGVLSERTRGQLENFLKEVYNGGGSQIQVAIVSSLGGVSVEEAGIKLMDAWKPGREKQDDGVILLVAPSERRLRIEVGQGREGDLPDVVASRIIREVITPLLKSGDYNRAVTSGVLAIVHYTDPKFNPSEPTRRTGSGDRKVGILGLFFILLFALLILGTRVGRTMLLFSLLSGGRGGGGFGGGFGGGGGWSGGGGSGSGGGASGSW